jgi:hypothetical protein
MKVRELIEELQYYEGEAIVMMRMFGDCDTIEEVMFNTDGDEMYCDLIGSTEWDEENE